MSHARPAAAYRGSEILDVDARSEGIPARGFRASIGVPGTGRPVEDFSGRLKSPRSDNGIYGNIFLDFLVGGIL